jgi:hypothetical protein
MRRNIQNIMKVGGAVCSGTYNPASGRKWFAIVIKNRKKGRTNDESK